MAYRGNQGNQNQPAEDGTFFEDYLESVANMPPELRRNFEQMRVLDRNQVSTQTDLVGRHKSYLMRARRKVAESAGADPATLADDPALMAQIDQLTTMAWQLVGEKTAIADQTYNLALFHFKRLKRDLAVFEQKLRDTGEFDVACAKSGDEVAARTDQYQEQWILARVQDYDEETGYYTVMDEDDNDKIYELPESQVMRLENQTQKLSKNDEVLAVYPDTTSFYKATVQQPPKRGTASGALMCGVEFEEDADETGATPVRPVSVKYVIKLPES